MRDGKTKPDRKLASKVRKDAGEFKWPFEISGFGGGYEAACRRMAKAGVMWLRSHEGEREKWKKEREEFERETGKKWTPRMTNSSQLDFENAILSVCEDCTGAMFGCARFHALLIFDKGWDGYVRFVKRERSKEK